MSPARPNPPHRLPIKLAALVLCLLLAAGGAAIARGSGNDDHTGALRDVAALLAGTSPEGSNNFACVPRERHPRPIVLVHGTFNNMRQNWSTLSPRLAAKDYCVFALNYGDTSRGGVNPFKARGSIAASAKQLARFVEAVRSATGAAKVDIVAYSQGGLMSRQYLRFEGGAQRVHALIGLAPSNRGTKTAAAQTARRLPWSLWLIRTMCRACEEQIWDSELIRNLNRGAMTLPGIEYTVISTRLDEVVKPWTDQRLPPGPGVTNVTLQEACPGNDATHLTMPEDPLALGWVEHALDPARVPEPSC